MKKRFLPFSLLLVIMILGQAVAIADQGGHYVPRTQPTMNAESFMGSLRANQLTGLIDPADMLKAMQAPVTRNAADDPLYWLTMGPDNMGGQTTAIVYDNKSNVVYIGSKGGGVYKTYNNGITWHQVGGLDLMVSCMAQDADGVIYVGTGDNGTAAAHNGLDQQGYDNSFVGTGLYTLTNDVFELVKSPSADEWYYINDVAVAGNTVIAATTEGLKYSNDKGQTWAVAIEGNAVAVKVASDNTIVAAIDGAVYIGSNVQNLVSHSGTGSTMQGDTLLPKAAGMLDIAIAPANPNVIYAACIGNDGKHSGVYVSENKGQNWAVALPNVSANQGHDIYGASGLYNHGLVVDPDNEGVLYVLGAYLWVIEKPESGEGFYLANQVTTDSYFYMPDYIHVGIHCMAFNPKNSNQCYIGTDGGIYKGEGRFTFSNSNRNYITTRMFNVAMSGKDTRVLAAGLDHGTVYIEGDENANTLGSGIWINPTGMNDGLYSESSNAGPCAISNVNPNTFFVTYKGGGLERTQTAGEDWVSVNFTSHASITLTQPYRLPIMIHEDFEDYNNPATVWFKNETGENIPADNDIQCMSNNGFPFNYTLDHTLAAGDSIQVQDPISSRLYVGCANAIYTTRMALDFAHETVWYELVQSNTDTLGFMGEFTGTPLCMAMDAEGENLFVGTIEGNLYRFMNETSATIDSVWYTYNSSGAVSNTYYQHFVSIDLMNLPTEGQCVTSVSVDPRNANNVVVTLGNYGNDNYVLYSNNALSANPTFTSKQANLPKMPVYSSVIEMATGDVILGTERGIYRTKTIANPTWAADNQMMGEVPVMELKQQLLYKENEQVVNVTDEGIFVTEYPGVYNTGVIYAATYGRGVFRCENYKKEFTSVPETPAVENVTVSMYPNPVSDQATVSFNLESNANVSYQVFDMTGRMVMSKNVGQFGEGSHQVTINTENLSTGSYILRLNQGASSSAVKFLVY